MMRHRIPIIYSTQVINNSVMRDLSSGIEVGDIINQFLRMKMENDLGVEKPMAVKSPSISDIYTNLMGNGVINEKDFGLETRKGGKFPVQHLDVHLAPSVLLSVERENGILIAKMNDDIYRSISLRCRSAEYIAKWIIRQKENYERYMDEWRTTLENVSKRMKGNRMAMLAIKAIFSESMKGYPHLRYDFIEQKKRLRIRVKLPNSRLGVYIDAWWGTYKELLPEQIEDLKLLVEAHSKISLKDFYISKR